jgi:GntR family transcriptional regulator / MocR family aminotransferase
VDRSSHALVERTTRGSHIDVSLNGVPRGRRGRTLADSLRTAVLNGTLPAGASLPSTRALAADLGVSRGVVVDAYAQLVAEGHLDAERGSGTRVIGPRPAGSSERTATRSASDVRQLAGHNPGQPDPALFPRREWLRSLARASAHLPDSAFSYGDMQGLPVLRDALADYLGRVRSIVTDPGQVIVANGFSQSLACIATMLVRRRADPAVAVEDPGSSGVVHQLRWWGIRPVRVRVDERGLDVSDLARHRVDAVVVTPAHQYPTGVTLAPERRHALIEWADRTGAFVVEDDYDAEYRYDREPLTSLHALDPERVIAAGSISKSLSPSMRLGWMVAPATLVAELADIKGNMDLGTAALEQAALADFITCGGLDRHLRRSRARYRQRRDALVAELRRRSPATVIAGIAAGLHVLVVLDVSADEEAVAQHARTLGFAAQPLRRYREAPGAAGIVLGYAALTPQRIRIAAAELSGSLVPVPGRTAPAARAARPDQSSSST